LFEPHPGKYGKEQQEEREKAPDDEEYDVVIPVVDEEPVVGWARCEWHGSDRTESALRRPRAQ
jgi:hypothetical protein